MAGRTLLVTGTSRGLGRSLAEHFLAQGDRVIGCARSASDIDHASYEHHQLDVSDESAVADLFYALRRQTRTLDGLINNAGVASMNALALTPVKSYHRLFDTNVKGTLLFCQKALPLLKRAPHPRIVNFTTVAVPLHLAGESLYAASKSAVETMTRVMAQEYGGFGITCNAIGPSPIATDLIAGVPAEKIQALVDQQAIPRMATSDDVLNCVDFFLQPESGMISGQVLYLGGLG